MGKRAKMSLKATVALACFCFGFVTFFFTWIANELPDAVYFRGFGQEKNKKHHYFFTSNLFSPVSLTRPPLRSHLSGERCPELSHDRCVLCRSELHNLPLFKVTDCCIPYSTPQCLFLQDKAHILPRSNTTLSRTLYQRIAGKDYTEENWRAAAGYSEIMVCEYDDAPVFFFPVK